MKIAIFGSGGVGGYFGGRLAAAGEDVTFLARGAHLTAMQQDGLHIASPLGDVHLPKVQATDRPQAIGPVDVVLFTVKLYDVDASAATLAPLIGPDTVVITLQNGVDAMDMVAKHVGVDHVAGGAAYIVVVIDQARSPAPYRRAEPGLRRARWPPLRSSGRVRRSRAARRVRREGQQRGGRRSVDQVRAPVGVERHDRGHAIADGRDARRSGALRDDDDGDRRGDRGRHARAASSSRPTWSRARSR